MQTSPASQKQLISGKLGWGWGKAVSAIAANSLSAGCFIFLISCVPILRWAPKSGDFNLVAVTLAVMATAFLMARHLARSILADCRQNQPFRFSTSFLIPALLLCLLLLVVLNLKLDPLLSIALIGSLWSVFASLLLGIAMWLNIWSAHSKPITDQDLAAVDHLSVTSYSDQTVLIGPTALSQQPQQFNSFVLLVMGLFLWTMLNLFAGSVESMGLPPNVFEIAAIALTSMGLVGLSTWQIQIQPDQQLMHLLFTGLWGLQADYTINLRQFPRLQIVKMQEGDLTWVQLSGQNNDIALPGKIIGSSLKVDEDNELCQVLLRTCNLARHATSRDSLGLIGILLPQGAGILAGVSFFVVGLLMLLFLPLPKGMVAEGAIALIGVTMLSPFLARSILALVAPTMMSSDLPTALPHIYAWEVGTALILSVITLPHQTNLITLSFAWLSFSVGVCILSLVRSTPIIIKT